MRGFMQGALGAVCAYGAAWWGTGEPASLAAPATASASARLERDVQRPSSAAPDAQPSSARAPAPRASASPIVAEPRVAQRAASNSRSGDRDALAGVAALPSEFAGAAGLPPMPDSLRQLAEFRQAAETPAELVERVERFEPTPAQLAEFRRVAAQLFNARPPGAEGESPWEPGGVRGGEGSLVRRVEQRASVPRSTR
jgi:hypothetical protein